MFNPSRAETGVWPGSLRFEDSWAAEDRSSTAAPALFVHRIGLGHKIFSVGAARRDPLSDRSVNWTYNPDWIWTPNLVVPGVRKKAKRTLDGA
jgi:hypothetical protein